MRQTRTVRGLALTLAVMMGTLAFTTGKAEAMMAPAAVAAASATPNRAQDWAKLQSALENKMVKQRLADMGLTEAQIDQRLSRLDDQRLHQVAMKLDQERAAGTSSDTAITILIVVAVVALIIWLYDQL